jgi:hypothetical protein
MYERFTDRARKALQLANQEAQRLNCEYVKPEHILVGIVKEGGGVAANVLKNLDVDLRKIRNEMEALSDEGQGTSPETLGKRVIENAMEESRRLQHSYVGTEHLLLGLLNIESSVARILAQIGVTPEAVRADVGLVLEQFKASLANDSNEADEHPGRKLAHRGFTRLVSAVPLAEYDAVVAYARELEQDRDRLAAIVAKLPKCWALRDGKLVQDEPITPGMTVWAIVRGDRIESDEVDSVAGSGAVFDDWIVQSGELHATREAAEATIDARKDQA